MLLFTTTLIRKSLSELIFLCCGMCCPRNCLKPADRRTLSQSKKFEHEFICHWTCWKGKRCVAEVPLLLHQDRDNKSYLATIVPRRLSSTSDIEEKENRWDWLKLVLSFHPGIYFFCSHALYIFSAVSSTQEFTSRASNVYKSSGTLVFIQVSRNQQPGSSTPVLPQAQAPSRQPDLWILAPFICKYLIL